MNLYIFSDGRKTQKDENSVQSLRRFIREIKGFRSVSIIEREQNLGLEKSVEAALDFIFYEKNNESAIIVEDDVCVSKYFISYCLNALDKYKKINRVKMIAPGSYGVPTLNKRSSFFLPLGTASAWATWKRVWINYEKQPSGTKVLNSSRWKRWKFNLFGAVNFSEILFNTINHGTQSSWASKFYWHIFKTKGVTLFPGCYLNLNVGLDGTGTHHKMKKTKPHHTQLFLNNQIVYFPNKIKVNKLKFIQLVLHLWIRKIKESIRVRLGK